MLDPILMRRDEMIRTMTEQEVQKHFVPPDTLLEYGNFAWDKGRNTARVFAEKYAGKTFEQFVAILGVKVTDRKGNGFYFSEYDTLTGQIVLFENVIKNGFICKEKERLLTEEYEKVRRLFLAHEVFHYLEFHDPSVGITYKEKQAVIFLAGKYKRRTGLRCLSEIAAHSFALAVAGKGVIKDESDQFWVDEY